MQVQYKGHSAAVPQRPTAARVGDPQQRDPVTKVNSAPVQPAHLFPSLLHSPMTPVCTNAQLPTTLMDLA
jgi:hypothetical protein